MERLAREGRLQAWKHKGFWQCMDNIREMEMLNALWNSGSAPWKIW
jgi:glucose-1-phosphate cytidylyltransferase